MIELSVARLREDAVLPSQAYSGDAGLDLAACERVEIAPGERAVVGTGVAVAIPAGHAGLVLPRSGLAARHGLGIVNAPGLIDAGYRGEVKAILEEAAAQATNAEIEAILDRWQRHWQQKGKIFSDSAELIREEEDRDSR